MSFRPGLLLSLPICLLLATSCAAQNHIIPDDLTDAQSKAFERIAKNVPNPCPEEEYQDKATLADLVNAKKVCHESWLVSETISFFVTAGFDEDEIALIAKAEARNLALPQEFTLNARPSKGPKNAAATIVVFSDFQCPFCGRAASTLSQVALNYPNDARIIFKHYPLIEMHPDALPAAMTAVYASHKDKFWETHDTFFAHQSDLSPAFIVNTLEALGGKVEEVFNAETGHVYASVIAEDMEDAQKARVHGTPTFFVNGVLLEGGLSYARLAHRIEAEKNAPPPAPMEIRQRARQRAREKCPYPSEKLQTLYQLLTDEDKLYAIDIADAIPCPCPNASGTLHECLSLATACDAAEPIMSRIMQRLNEGASEDMIIQEIMRMFIEARMNHADQAQP